MAGNKTIDCIKQYGPEDLKGQRAIYNKIKQNTIDPGQPSTHSEKISAMSHVLKELATERQSIVSQIEKAGAKMTGSKSAKIKERIVELQSAIDDPGIPEPIKARYEAQLDSLIESVGTKSDSPVASGDLVQTYSTKKSDWTRVKKEGTEIYSQGNAIIQKLGERKWVAMKKDPKGEMIPYGDDFKRMSHAIEALAKDQTSEQYYPEKAKKAKAPLTPEQSKLLESVDIKKYSEMVVNSVPEVKGDPEALGVAVEAIMDSARGWKAEKAGNAKFSTYSFKYARGKVLGYYKQRSEIQSREVSSSTVGEDSEGSQTETKVENVSKREMASVPKQARPKAQTEAEMKGEATPLKKVELSDAEKKATLDRIKAKGTKPKVAEDTEITATEWLKDKEAKIAEGEVSEDTTKAEKTTDEEDVEIQTKKAKEDEARREVDAELDKAKAAKLKAIVESKKKSGVGSSTKTKPERNLGNTDSTGKKVSTEFPKEAKTAETTLPTGHIIKEIVGYVGKMYHGTKARWTGNFKNSRLTFLTDNRELSKTYKGSDGQIKEVQVNLQTPYVIDWEGRNWNSGPRGVGSAAQVATNIAKGKHFDGVIFLNIVDPGPNESSVSTYNREPSTQIVVLNDSAIQGIESKDEANIIIRKPKSKFLGTVKQETTPVTEEANKILQRTKWSKQEAIRVASSIKDATLRQNVIAHIESIQQNTIGGILQQAMGNSVKGSQTYKLADYLSKLLTNPSKRAIKVVVDPSLSNAYFDPNTGVVHLTDTTTDLVGLHEVVHAITSRELQVNPELKAKVRQMIDAVKAAIVKDPNVKISAADLKRLEGITTSAEFQREFGNESFKGDRGILYALVNEKEFLAQAFNDGRVQEILLGIESPVKASYIKSLFDYVVSIFTEIFGKTRVHNNMMKEVLHLTAELSQIDLSYGKVVNRSEVDGMFAGVLSETADNSALKRAAAMEDAGIDSETIRKETGWVLEKDDEWKYEIDDSRGRFTEDLTTSAVYDVLEFSDDGKYALGDIFKHDKLFEAYPILRDLDVQVLERINGSETTLGGYNNKTKTIYLKQTDSLANMRKTLIHEIQHWVQHYEGFAIGGNIETVRLTDVADRMESLYNKRLESVINANVLDTEAYEALSDNLEVIKDVKKHKSTLESMYDFIASRELSRDEKDALKANIESLFRDKDAYRAVRYDVYRLIAGESEARNAAKRSKYSQSKRWKIDPDVSMDVDPFYTIVFKDDVEVGEVSEIDMADTGGTPKKKEKVVQKTWDQRDDIMEAKDTRSTLKGTIQDYWDNKITKFVKDIAVSTTERLREIHPMLMNYVRRFEFAINNYNVKYHEEAKGFVDKYKKLDKRTRRRLDQTLRNNYPEDIEERWRLLKQHDMVKEYEKVDAVLKDIQKRKQKVALGQYKEIEGYWPRKVKDLTALMQTIENDPNFGIIEAELKAAGLNDADRQVAIQNMIHTGRYPALALLKPGSEKKRTIKRVSSEWAHHYDNSVDALINHIYESNEAIEARNMFGDVRRATLVRDRDELYKKLEGLKNEKARRPVVAKIASLEDALSKYEEEWDKGIATLLAKEGHKLGAVEQMEAISLIRGRLLQKGMTGVPAMLRNVSLMSVLNGPASAITQIADIAVNIHKNGLINAGGSLFGNRTITTKDLDMSHSLKDFQTGGSAKWLDNVLWFSGMKFMDTFGKNAFMNASILKAKKQSLADFTKEWEAQLGEDTQDTWEELRSGEKTDLTRFFAFNALSEYQPTSMSEMPLKYLQAGNGRIFYALKSFNLKSINNLRREIWTKTRTAKTPKERAEAIANGAKLLTLMVLAGATADELKDLISGRDVDISDNVSNNLLKVFFLNSYMLEQGDKRNMLKTIIGDTILPPTRVADDIYSDVKNLMDGDPDTETTVKFLRSVPWGALVYAHATEGAQKTNASMIKKRISEKIKDGGNISDVRSDMVKYNKLIRGTDEKIMTYKSIQSMKKRNDKKK